jgi:hypothetical protein
VACRRRTPTAFGACRRRRLSLFCC